MKDLTKFINKELKPKFYDNVPSIFPSLHFKRKAGRWESGLHADGTEGTGERADRCVVTERQPTKVFDNTRQQAYDIISLFKDINGIPETYEAVNKLCDIVGISRPEYTPEAKAQYAKAEKRRTELELSHQRQIKALFSVEGREALEYMLSRGWTMEDIRKAELGFISANEATTINAQRSVGDYYTLSIPLRSGSTLYGFKFRTIRKDNSRDKYIYLTGTRKSENLFNLTGVQQKHGSIIVVEGELDALHAEVKGIKGVVATGGGKLTEDLLKAAIQRGIKKITFLQDKDKAGEKFVKEGVEMAHAYGITVLVATFPEETLPNGKAIHDVDEYLQRHSAEELKALIEQAYFGSQYLLSLLIESYEEKNRQGMEDGTEADLRNEVIALANHTPNEVERDAVLTTYAQRMRIDDKQAFSPEAMRAVADRERAAENALKQQEETKKALKEATELAEKGDPQKALQRVAEAVEELRRIDSRAKYSYLLAATTEEKLFKRMKEKPDEIPTLYELSNGYDKEIFSLPTGAITFVCAGTSHGKSTFLQNLALQTAKNEAEGDVLYFTFEEDGDAVALQMVNKYVGAELCRNYSSDRSNNMRAIRHYYKTGEDRYIGEAAKATFKERKAEFMQRFYTSGKLRIYYEDFSSEELTEAIRTIASQRKVKAVFIDYIQLLSSTFCKKVRMQRTEELKEICKSLKNLAIELQIAIIVAAQLNREAVSPLELFSQRIAEAADLERVANKVLCLWSSAHLPQKSKDSTKDLEELEKRLNFKLGKGGKLYAKLTKNRGGVVGLEAVFNWNGNTGVIEGNYTPPQSQDSTPKQKSPIASFASLKEKYGGEVF